MTNKIDSNLTGLSFAEESALKTLPGVDGADAVWFGLEPNSYSDFGGNINSVARAPINPSRQRQKGSPVGLDASGGFNTDFTQNNLTRLLQGFFFADAREKADTKSFGSAAIPITAVDGVNDQYEAAAGLDAFAVGNIVLAEGFGIALNNGIKVLDGVAAGAIDSASDLTAEAAPPAGARVRVVGHQFAAGDLSLTAAAGGVTLSTVAKNLTTLGLTPGEWLYIGGDDVATKFATAADTGYGRIRSIAANAIVLDETTFAAVTDAGAAKTIQLFFGLVIRNEKDPTLIVRRSYQFERQLGDNGAGVQAEYLPGSVLNEMTLNLPMEDKATMDLTFVSLDNEQNDGATGIKAGSRVDSLGEAAINTSTNIFRSRLSVIPSISAINAAPLFGYVSESKLTINNGVTPLKALGVFGGFDTTAGDFAVSGSVEAYFTDVSTVQAVRNNADVGYNLIVAHDNHGMVWDMPLLALGGGRNKVEKDQAIKIPLETNAAENANGYTLMLTHFAYLPNAAMPA